MNIDSHIFGSGFRKHAVEIAKVKKESKEVYRDHQKDIKRPFRKGPALVARNVSMKVPSLNRTSAVLSQHNSRCTIGQSAFVDIKVVQKFQHSRVPLIRKTAVFCEKLANSNQKSKNFAMDLRHRASVFKITKSKFTPILGKNETRRKYFGSGGNTGNVEERSNSVYLTPKMGVYKQFFLVEERWCSQASNKPQKFEEIFAIPIFQDRGSTLSKGLVATEGLYRLEGCLLLRSTLQKLPEVYMFSMRRELVLNSMSLL